MNTVSGCAARLLIAAVVASAATGADAAPPTCDTAKTKVLASTMPKSTTSVAYVAVPEGAINFNLTAPGCVLVQFYSEYDAAGSIVVRALLDTATAAVPAEVTFGTQVSNYNSHAMSFVFAAVPAGVHTVKLQYKSGEGLVTNIGSHTTIVFYKP